MITPSISALAALLSAQLALAASSAEWRSRSIYQVMTDRFALTNGSTTVSCDAQLGVYCGGTWAGIRNKLDYIQNMGFDAIWISPVTKQLSGNSIDGESYHGYWQQDLYQLNANFGEASDLQALAQDLHARGMYLMVDVVTNHFGWNGAPSTIEYSDFYPFNDASHFHPYCSIDYNDISNTTNLEQCWEGDENVSLPDLRTEDSDVVGMFSTWIAQLVSNYSIDGLRIDSVLEVDTGFWQEFQQAAGVYSVGEVDNGDASLVCGFQDYLPGILNYGTYFSLVDAFKSTSGSISELATAIDNVKSSCKDTSLLGTFSENQDQPRFGQLTQDFSQAKNVLTFTMLTDGIPIIYEGQEQHYESYGGSGVPYNREAIWLSDYNTEAELYGFITTLNAVRSNAINGDSSFLTDQMSHFYTDNTTMALRKGQLVLVLSNLGSEGSSYTLSLNSGYTAGTRVVDLLTCNALVVGRNGQLQVPMSQGLPRVYYPQWALRSGAPCAPSNNKYHPRLGSRYWASKEDKVSFS